MGAPRGLPVAASQSRAVLSSTAGEDGLAVGAEGHGQTPALMGDGRPDRLCPWPRPRAVAVLSQLPVRTVLPSGLNATA